MGLCTCINSGGRGFESPARIILLSSHDFNNSLAFDKKKREEEEESCRRGLRGLSSWEDGATIGIRRHNIKKEGMDTRKEKTVQRWQET